MSSIRDNIIKLWNSEFPPEAKENRFMHIESEETKDEIIDYYVKRLKFCDKIKPKLTQISRLDIDTMMRIWCSDKLRIELFKDIQKSKFNKDIQKKYNSTLSP